MTGTRAGMGTVLLLALLAALAGGAWAADAKEPPTNAVADASAGATHPEPALVMVFNRPIMVLRAKSYGYTPAERAKRIADRIDGILEQGVYGPVQADAGADGVRITIGGHWALMVMAEDVDPFARKSLDETVQEAVEHLKTALDEARLQESPAYLLKAAGRAVAATVVFILLVLAVRWAMRRARPHVTEMERRLDSGVTSRGLFVISRVARCLHWLPVLIGWGLVLAAGVTWLAFCLKAFPYTRPWGEGLRENLVAGVEGVLQAMVGAVPDLLVMALIAVVAWGVNAVAHGFFSGVESGRVTSVEIDPGAARATRRILTIVIWLIAIVMMYPYIPGSDSAAFKGMSVFVGVLLSLGSSSVMGQFMSGLVLMYSRALKPGEYVRINEHEGTVESLGFLSTKLRSNKNEEVHIPNTVILSTTIKNYTRLAEKNALLIHSTVTIGYNVPWRQVHAMLRNAAERTPGICAEPTPFVLQTALSDFYVEYQVNAHLERPESRVKVLSELHASIQDEFNRHGVQIMSPHYERDTETPAVVPPEKWYTPPAKQDEAGQGGKKDG